MDVGRLGLRNEKLKGLSCPRFRVLYDRLTSSQRIQEWMPVVNIPLRIRGVDLLLEGWGLLLGRQYNILPPLI